MRGGLSIEARFWAKVDKKSPNECWPWTGGKTVKGYGSIRHKNRKPHVHDEVAKNVERARMP